jgi:hypothetical protein
MIIKTLSRKTNTSTLVNYIFKNIFEYITDEKKLVASELFLVRHNVKSQTISGYIKEFEANEKLRIRKRKNSPCVYHTILSWHKEDAKYLDNAKLRIMAKEFVRLRGDKNLYVISKHLDREHVHLHCAISATNIEGKSSRLSKNEFEQLKLKIDVFQKEKFPELSHSLPQHGKKREERKLWVSMQKELKSLQLLRANNDREVEQNYERVRELRML